ncbi:MAG: STAS domain-containing protein [Xanthomonadales bacterium]|jgi:anti-sigma B factor antagonist|nr:STAS domain-containing protein [Xanthomonadales bacterium]
MLQIVETREADVIVLLLNGRIDTSTAADLEAAAEPHMRGPSQLLVDLGGIQYVSSAGLRIFLMMAKKLKIAKGRLVLCAMSQAVREVFDLAGLSRIFDIQVDQAAGLERLQ